MIGVLDLHGNSYPIPSYQVHRIGDIRAQLSQRYNIANVDLSWKQTFLTDEKEIEPEMRDGSVPIAMVPHGQLVTLAQASGTKCELGVESFSTQRFSNFSFTPGVAHEPSESDDDEPIEAEDDFLGPLQTEEESDQDLLDENELAMVFRMLIPFGLGFSLPSVIVRRL
jgi:hypothetical protein